jgi:dCTP deaminase
MQLSDTDIKHELEHGDLTVTPIEDEAVQIQPASIDVRLDNEFLKQIQPNTATINPLTESVEDYMKEYTIDDDETYTIHPGDFILGSVNEWIEIPDYLTGYVEGRSTIGRLGVVVHATAGLLDPGWEGNVTLEISNLGRVPIELTPGMRIAQITFVENKSPSEIPYGEERGSKYQGQTGVQSARTDNIDTNPN